MTKNEILKELNKAFKDFVFYEEDHHYEYKGQRVGMSVTRLIEEYANEFDEQKMALITTKNTDEAIVKMKEWKQKNEYACIKGSLGHEFIQTLWKTDWHHDEPFLINSYKLANKDLENDENIKKINFQALHFYQDYNDRLEHLADEFVIGSKEYDIASAIDHLFINKLTGGLVLVDYKTNSDVYKDQKYYKEKKRKPPKMKIPLNKIEDLTINHYYIQLSIYKYLVEKYTKLKIEDMFIVYISENIDNYEIIEIPYLKDEVEKILENRRIKNMKSVPVLLIGKSGSGKSASLRNFKKDEIAIANVLGKPLPFKTDLEAPKVDDYNIILKAIQNTNKKVIVIDDANYLITNEFMNKSSVKGFDKYNEMGNNFFNLINGIKNIEGGKTVYLIMHEDTDEEGNVKPKTIGKLLDDKVNIQGMFTICIRAMFDNGNYIFRLKTNGQDCVKTPIGLFEEDQMENDLKKVDEKIREYYDLDKEGEN